MKLADVSFSALTLLVAMGCGSSESKAAPPTRGSGGESAATGSAGASAIETAEPVVNPVARGWIGSCEQFESGTDEVWNSEDEIPINFAESVVVSSGDSVVLDGCAKIRRAGTYRLSGSAANGCLRVDTKEQGVVRLILDNLTLASKSGAPIEVLNAQKVILVLPEGSASTLVDAPERDAASEANATIYSEENMVIIGGGMLNVIANYNDAIASKDGLIIKSGALSVSAVDDGIRGKDCLVVAGASVTVNATGDGLKADNEDDVSLGYISLKAGSLDITSGGDAISAATTLYVTEGTLRLTSGGGSSESMVSDTSAKGLKGAAGVVVDGGSFEIDSVDDAIHAGTAIYVNGGTFELSSGDDAVHSDASVVITGGMLNITKSYEGIEGGTIQIDDGTIHVVSSDDGLNASDGSATINEPEAFNPGAIFGQGGAAGSVTSAPQSPWGGAGGAAPVAPPFMGTRAAPPGAGMIGLGAAGANDGMSASSVFGGTGLTPIEGGNGEVPGAAATTSDLLLAISGGKLVVDASGDGLDSNGNIIITGGTVLVNGPIDDFNAALDVGDCQTCAMTISGGLLIAAGSAGMAEAPSAASTQHAMMLTTGSMLQGAGTPAGVGASGSSTVSALAGGTLFHLSDATGRSLITYAPTKSYASVVFSSPELVTGSYLAYTAGSCSGIFIDNLCEGGSYRDGTLRATVVVSSDTTSTAVRWTL